MKSNNNLPKIGKAWRKIRDRLIKADIDNSTLDARLLAQYAFGKNTIDLAVDEHEIVSERQLSLLNELAQRRLSGEPIARILGKKEFYSLEFKLNKATLVPRPESELLVDLALEQIEHIKKPHLLELGVGTGCISIAILKNNKYATILGTDISELALDQAKENALIHKVEQRIKFQHSSWFEKISNTKKFDLIISNPPYIETKKIKKLAIEVCNFDPILALDGSIDGLEPYRAIASGSKNHLNNGGVVIVECGYGQEERIIEIFAKRGFLSFELKSDLSLINRALIFHKN